MSLNGRYMFSNMAKSLHCPGFYCGRLRLGDSGNYTDCGSCPRGYRVNGSLCEECVSSPDLYDWFYLGFMVLLSIYIQGWIIDKSRWRLGHRAFVLEFCCLLENVFCALLSLLSFEPIGSLVLTTCRAQRLTDWYTLLNNPTPNYKQTIHCSQEAVYPLYSIVFIYLGYSVLSLIFFRGFFIPKLFRAYRNDEVRKTVYIVLYAIPIMGITHAIFAGLIYYAFPYLIIIFSVISIACHLAARSVQTVAILFRESLEPRNLIVILAHWFIHAFALIGSSINAYGTDAFYGLILVPLPTFFYIFTSSFTDPELFND